MPSSIHVAAHTGAEGRAPGHMGLVTTAPLWGPVPGPNFMEQTAQGAFHHAASLSQREPWSRRMMLELSASRLSAIASSRPELWMQGLKEVRQSIADALQTLLPSSSFACPHHLVVSFSPPNLR